MDLGGNRRGVDMGPSAIRYAGLRDRLASLGYSVRDRGNIRVADRDEGATKHLREGANNEHAKMDGPAPHVYEVVRGTPERPRVLARNGRAGASPDVPGRDH